MRCECRLADEHDLPELAQMRWDFSMEDPSRDPLVSREEFIDACVASRRDRYRSSDWFFWLATVPDVVVAHIFGGLVHAIPRPWRLEDRYGYMTNVYTRPDFRNQGIGSILLAHVVGWARRQDLALLIVSPSDRSVPFYSRQGFAWETDFMQFKSRDD